MAFGQLNKRCKDGSRRLYEDEIRSVEGLELLPQRPAGQEERQSDGSEEHHDRRDDQCQQESNMVRLVNSRASVSVSVLVSVHVPAFLLDKREETIPS